MKNNYFTRFTKLKILITRKRGGPLRSTLFFYFTSFFHIAPLFNPPRAIWTLGFRRFGKRRMLKLLPPREPLCVPWPCPCCRQSVSRHCPFQLHLHWTGHRRWIPHWQNNYQGSPAQGCWCLLPSKGKFPGWIPAVYLTSS